MYRPFFTSRFSFSSGVGYAMRPILLIMWTAFQSFILRQNNNNTLRVRTRWKVVVGTASNTCTLPRKGRCHSDMQASPRFGHPHSQKSISLGFWEQGFLKRRDTHITVTAEKVSLPFLRWKTLGTRFRQTACKFVQVIAWFAVIFGINTTIDTSKFLWWNFQLILKYQEQIMLLLERLRFTLIANGYNVRLNLRISQNRK